MRHSAAEAVEEDAEKIVAGGGEGEETVHALQHVVLVQLLHDGYGGEEDAVQEADDAVAPVVHKLVTQMIKEIGTTCR